MKKTANEKNEKKSRFSEGEKVDVVKYLEDHDASPEAIEDWKKYDGKVEDIKKKKASIEKNLARALAKVALQHPQYRKKVARLLGIV